jgi:protein-S-isoprenylcysteine O-methyltransferase Ste14
VATRTFVWLGGALFVASLAYCVWWYAVILANPSPGISWIAVPFDILLVGVFALHHSVFAREQVKVRLAKMIPQPLLRSVYVWTASLLLIAVCALWLPVGGEFYRATGARRALHLAIQLYGGWLIVQAVRGIDPLELAGIRRESDRGPLQVGGPYAIVRHPLYLGWLCALFGAAHMTGDRLAFAAITTAYLLLAIPWEERSLMRSFGEDYARYKRAVRWRILPFIY